MIESLTTLLAALALGAAANEPHPVPGQANAPATQALESRVPSSRVLSSVPGSAWPGTQALRELQDGGGWAQAARAAAEAQGLIAEQDDAPGDLELDAPRRPASAVPT